MNELLQDCNPNNLANYEIIRIPEVNFEDVRKTNDDQQHKTEKNLNTMFCKRHEGMTINSGKP